MPHTTDNGLQIAIEEAKKMRDHQEGYYQNIKVEVLDELIQRLEARAEVATEDDLLNQKTNETQKVFGCTHKGVS